MTQLTFQHQVACLQDDQAQQVMKAIRIASGTKTCRKRKGKEEVDLYATSHNSERVQDELAQQVIKAMCRKFATSAKVWLRAYGHAAERHDSETARKALDRSMSSLPKRKHIKASTLCSLISIWLGPLTQEDLPQAASRYTGPQQTAAPDKGYGLMTAPSFLHVLSLMLILP